MSGDLNGKEIAYMARRYARLLAQGRDHEITKRVTSKYQAALQEIKALVNSGSSCTHITIPRDSDYDFVNKLLVEDGFTLVNYGDGELISWW